MVSVGHVGGTRGSGIVSSAPDVQWRRGVGEMCMCLTRGGMSGEGVSGEGVSGEGVSGLGLGFTNPVGTGGLLGLCVCAWVALRWCMWGVGKGLGPRSRGVVLRLCEMWVWIRCVDGRSRYMCIVFDGYLRI